MFGATMRKTILVVDDDPTIRDVLERYLQREGFVVLTVADGQAALQTRPCIWFPLPEH